MSETTEYGCISLAMNTPIPCVMRLCLSELTEYCCWKAVAIVVCILVEEEVSLRFAPLIFIVGWLRRKCAAMFEVEPDEYKNDAEQCLQTVRCLFTVLFPWSSYSTLKPKCSHTADFRDDGASSNLGLVSSPTLAMFSALKSLSRIHVSLPQRLCRSADRLKASSGKFSLALASLKAVLKRNHSPGS